MSDFELQQLLKELRLGNDQLKEVYKRYGQHIEQGLSKDMHTQADTKCYITYVQDLPSGEELGQFLALDLGGTNFRVLLVTLKGHHDAEVKWTTYAIPKDLMLGSGEQLFDYIADCLQRFTNAHNLNGKHLPLGFTFSFPCKQLGLKRALLRRWTKGFNCSGVENEDVGQLLKQAIARNGNSHIDCVAVLNDTTGTLMSCAHRNPKCRIGVIVGTGCNVCYVERVENVHLLDTAYKHKPYMLINTECGAFGDSGTLEFIRTEYDHAVDALTPNAKTQYFEKMISGMYLGELVRFILLKAVRSNLMFSKEKQIMDVLAKKVNCFETRLISEIEADSAPEFTHCKRILRGVLGLTKVSDEDCNKLKLICECISRRAAALVGVAISVLINKINEDEVVVGIDGSVYRFHPNFDAYMRETIKLFVKDNIKFDLMLSEDGSGRGAALVAAVAASQQV